MTGLRVVPGYLIRELIKTPVHSLVRSFVVQGNFCLYLLRLRFTRRVFPSVVSTFCARFTFKKVCPSCVKHRLVKVPHRVPFVPQPPQLSHEPRNLFDGFHLVRQKRA